MMTENFPPQPSEKSTTSYFKEKIIAVSQNSQQLVKFDLSGIQAKREVGREGKMAN